MENLCNFLCIVLFNVIVTNSGTTLLKLNSESGRIVESVHYSASTPLAKQNSEHMRIEDEIFDIITSTVYSGNTWSKNSKEVASDESVSDCAASDDKPLNDFELQLEFIVAKENLAEPAWNKENPVDCGKPVNFTYYDNLVGVANRNKHPIVPDPTVIKIFEGSCCGLDLRALEKRLKRLKKEKPKSVQVYIQIGNYWRIVGDARRSIECSRRVLSSSPSNVEALLSLGKVLFNLQYLDDAIFVIRRSLDADPSSKTAWQQYFALGEIFKAYGRNQEAILHLQQALKLKPGFELAILSLKEMEIPPGGGKIHTYTIIIIVILISGVILAVKSMADK